MSQSLGPNARRLLGQTPAAFQRQCRANGHRIAGRIAIAVNVSSTRTYHDEPRPWCSNSRYEGSGFLSIAASRSRYSDGQVRGFSQSVPQRATTILQNPRVDEDGKEMRIEISDRAAKRLQQIVSSSGTSPLPSPTQSPSSTSTPTSQEANYDHLRVSVTSGGCHGFQYLMSLEPASAIENDVDTIFASTLSSSNQSPPPPPLPPTEPQAAKVVLDDASLDLLKGSTVDYTTELIGSQFTIRGNPRAKSSCGCGTSFDIED